MSAVFRQPSGCRSSSASRVKMSGRDFLAVLSMVLVEPLYLMQQTSLLQVFLRSANGPCAQKATQTHTQSTDLDKTLRCTLIALHVCIPGTSPHPHTTRLQRTTKMQTAAGAPSSYRWLRNCLSYQKLTFARFLIWFGCGFSRIWIAASL